MQGNERDPRSQRPCHQHERGPARETGMAFPRENPGGHKEHQDAGQHGSALAGEDERPDLDAGHQPARPAAEKLDAVMSSSSSEHAAPAGFEPSSPDGRPAGRNSMEIAAASERRPKSSGDALHMW